MQFVALEWHYWPLVRLPTYFCVRILQIPLSFTVQNNNNFNVAQYANAHMIFSYIHIPSSTLNALFTLRTEVASQRY